jgi:rubrerythrin
LVKYGVPEEVEELLDNARFMEAYRTYTHYNKNGFGVELRGNKVHVIEVEMDHEISNVMRESWGV